MSRTVKILKDNRSFEQYKDTWATGSKPCNYNPMLGIRKCGTADRTSAADGSGIMVYNTHHHVNDLCLPATCYNLGFLMSI
jgi:hypothetical protein